MNPTAATRSEPPLASEPLDVSFESDGLTVLERNFALHGDAFRIFSPLLSRQIWVLSHPDHVRHVLVDRSANFTKGIGIDRVAILLGNGLMTSEGEAWRAQRKLVQPSFHRSVIATWMPHLHAANAALAAKWARAAAEGAAVNVTQDMSEATLEVVLRALFGADLPRLTEGRDGNPFALLTDDTARNLAFAYKFRQLGTLIMEEVRRRRRDGVRHDDIVSHLIDARDRRTGAPMADRQLQDEILTLIVAGHETTASSLNWFWYLLSQAPAVAARIHAEVDAGGLRCPRLRRSRQAALHARGDRRDAAPLSAGLAADAAVDRRGQRGRDRAAREGGCPGVPVPRASASGALARCRAIRSGALSAQVKATAGIASPIFRSDLARGPASANIWRWWRCTRTSPRSRAASTWNSCQGRPSNANPRSTCARAIHCV